MWSKQWHPQSTGCAIVDIHYLTWYEVNWKNKTQLAEDKTWLAFSRSHKLETWTTLLLWRLVGGRQVLRFGFKKMTVNKHACKNILIKVLRFFVNWYQCFNVTITFFFYVSHSKIIELAKLVCRDVYSRHFGWVSITASTECPMC